MRTGPFVPTSWLGRIEARTATVASAGAGTYWALIQPPDGEMWLILNASAWHTVGAGRTCNWAWLDPLASTNLYQDTVLASAVDWPLFTTAAGLVITHGPLIATRTRYPRFAMVATGAGENAFTRAIVAIVTDPTGQM
jgi:hypothetical protein